MVKVYAHTIEVGGRKHYAVHKRTAEAIERLAYRDATIILGTEEEVDPSSLDGEGRFMPPGQTARGIYRMRGAGGIEDYAQVEEVSGYSRPVDESKYRAEGFEPPFDDLPWSG
jgi:hypothetical protein